MRFLVLISATLFTFGCSKKQESVKVEPPISFERYKKMADSCYHKKDYKHAIEYFNHLIPLDSLNGELFYKRGISYSLMHEYGNTSKDLLKAIKYGHRVADAYYVLATMEILNLNDSLVLVYLEKSLEANPNDLQVISTLRYFKDLKSGKKVKTSDI